MEQPTFDLLHSDPSGSHHSDAVHPRSGSQVSLLSFRSSLASSSTTEVTDQLFLRQLSRLGLHIGTELESCSLGVVACLGFGGTSVPVAGGANRLRLDAHDGRWFLR